MDLHKITIELARPRGSFPGKIAEGWHIVNDDTVTLVESNSVPVDKHKFSRKVEPGADARGTACRMLRQRHSGTSGDFNRTIIYPPFGKI